MPLQFTEAASGAILLNLEWRIEMKAPDYNDPVSVTNIAVGHMWRKNGLSIPDQIKVRAFRVARLVELEAPLVILENEIKMLTTLTAKQLRVAAERHAVWCAANP